MQGSLLELLLLVMSICIEGGLRLSLEKRNLYSRRTACSDKQTQCYARQHQLLGPADGNCREMVLLRCPPLRMRCVCGAATGGQYFKHPALPLPSAITESAWFLVVCTHIRQDEAPTRRGGGEGTTRACGTPGRLLAGAAACRTAPAAAAAGGEVAAAALPPPPPAAATVLPSSLPLHADPQRRGI